MVARRPIVRTGGRDEQLPAGDTLLGVPAYMPAYQANGALLRLALNLNYSLPAQLAGGGMLSIQVVLNG